MGHVLLLHFLKHNVRCTAATSGKKEVSNITLDKYMEIVNGAKSGKKEVIIAGDINAKSHLWGSPTTDKKGEHWSEWIAALNLVVQNTGLTPTFVRGETQSFIDVTLSTPKIAARVMDWQVFEEESLTEHRFISYVVKTNKPPRCRSEKSKCETDWDAFNANLKLRLANRTSREVCSYKMCANIIKEAYINSFKEGPKGEKTVPYWWSDEISAKRKECTMSRRSLTKMTNKCGNEEKKLQAKENYKERKKSSES
ncbi:Endonuclease-reverse transcriptase [Popillia japonica]|uniref:Endonuclease-reverse transcriptase n=1 Tax=Popillia japonica TaxID=7064 RepID=A0AAW1JUF8_POPJA